MGRPEDEFVRKHAEKSENGWKCNYCRREFKKTSVSRMRVHLSRVGDANISGCEDVPIEIADEALEKINKKRGRKSCEGEVNDGVIVGNLGGKKKDPLTQRAHEEYVTDALLKFFVYKKATVSASKDFMDDPNFKEFLERVDQYGVPPSLLIGETLVVEKSLLNIKDVVNKYMLEVMDSWKTTGCTLIGFNPKDMKVESLDPDKDKFAVLGFYSPKGFIFFEGPDITSYPKCNLKTHFPTLDIDGVKLHVVKHLSEWDCEGNLSTCEFSDAEISRWISSLSYTQVSGQRTQCVCHTMQAICIDVCKKSEWAQSLMKTAENMHHCLANNSFLYRREYYKAVKKINFKGLKDGKHVTPIVRFLAFMTFERDELKKFVPHSLDMSFLDDSNFWFDGYILKSVLCYLLKEIPDIMDTLVPTAGYCWQAIMYVHFAVSDEYKEALKSELRDKYTWLYTAAFLNPCYVKSVDEGERLNLIEAVKKDLFNPFDCKMEEFAYEVERYSSEISKPESRVIYHGEHPVKWWQQNGNAYPLLHNYVIQILSRPVSCMCNQVKKHVLHLEGAEDYILRLNVRMMEEYKSLGDNIYKPIHF